MSAKKKDTDIPTILVVDDNQQNLELLLAYLEDIDCKTLPASGGVEASPGKKDHERIRKFIKEAKSAIQVS